MPNALIKKIAERSNVSVKEVEKDWRDIAMKQAGKKFPKCSTEQEREKSKKRCEKFYRYATAIIERMYHYRPIQESSAAEAMLAYDRLKMRKKEIQKIKRKYSRRRKTQRKPYKSVALIKFEPSVVNEKLAQKS